MKYYDTRLISAFIPYLSTALYIMKYYKVLLIQKQTDPRVSSLRGSH